ncbi:hypothetical protein JCM10213_001253 [Rhodosporidiobolus nylandii]
MSAGSLSASDKLTPEEMLSLPRPQQGVPNPSGTLALWPSSTYSFAAADGKGRTDRAIHIADLASSPAAAEKSTGFDKLPPPRPLLTGLANLEAAWLDDHTVLFLRPSVPHGEVAAQDEQGRRVDHPARMGDDAWKKKMQAWSEMDGGEGTEVWAKEVDGKSEEYMVGRLPVPISNLSVLPPSSTSASSGGGKPKEALLSFSATVYADGSLWTVAQHAREAAARAAGSDAKTYDGLFVRHWDTWAPTDGEREQVFVVRLTRNAVDLRTAAAEDGSDSDASLEDFEIVEKPQEQKVGGAWRFAVEEQEDEAGVLQQKPKVMSPLAGTSLQCPVGPFGSASDWSLSSTHLLFHAKDPHLNPAYHTRHQVYLVPLSPRSASDATPRQITLGTQGATASPVFSPCGKRVAWLEMREDGYEADRNRVMVYELESGVRWGASEEWDRSPSAITWAKDGKQLFLEAEDEGLVKLFVLDVPVGGPAKGEKVQEPVRLTQEHSVTGVSALAPFLGSAKKGAQTLLVTQSSLTSPNQLYVLTFTPSPSLPPAPPTVSLRPLASLTYHHLAPKGLHAGEEFTFAGDAGRSVHGWIVYPPELAEDKRMGVKKEKKYPLAFLCHGGPQSAWDDAWSTRWNPNVFASHGYIVVAINRTGSTGFGQEFCDAIKGDWGGAPFRDLVAGLQFVKDAYPEIDGERTACLGASYGGFMVNWIQGHNEQMRFKALVCHDGVFTPTQTWNATDELYFPEREFGGVPWEVPANYQKWSPANFIGKWRTPQLVIHGSKDYRLVEAEGLGVFNTLQRLNIPSRLVIFPSENHWVLNPRNSRRWHEEVFRWIDEWTAAPSSVEEAAAQTPADKQPQPTVHTAPPSAAETSKPGYTVAYREV